MGAWSRRGFLAAAGAMGVTAWAGPLRAMEPVRRIGRGRMRLSLAAYSMRQHLTAEPTAEGAMDLLGFVEWAATLNLRGVEPTSYYFPAQVPTRYLVDLKRRCHINGLDITGGAIRNNFTLPPGEELEEWFAHVEVWAERYQTLGAPVMRVFAGVPPRGVSEAEAIRRCIPNLERACEIAARRGVMLALENHDFTTNVDRLMQIVEAVNSPWFGVNLDSGNFHSADPYADMVRAAPYAINVQVKTHIRRSGGGSTEPADLARVVSILKDAGYSGPVVLEYEGREEPYEAVPRHLDELAGLIGG